MSSNNITNTLEETRLDLEEALEDLKINNLIDFNSSINRERSPKKGKHVTVKVEYITRPKQ